MALIKIVSTTHVWHVLLRIDAAELFNGIFMMIDVEVKSDGGL